LVKLFEQLEKESLATPWAMSIISEQKMPCVCDGNKFNGFFSVFHMLGIQIEFKPLASASGLHDFFLF